MQNIESKISAAFHGGELKTRELRLTEDEAAYVRAHFAADVRSMGGMWYQITFMGSAA